MRKINLLFLLFAAPLALYAQHDSQTEYNMFRLPASAHAAALGGENITLTDDDISLVFSNPALLCNVADKTIGFNYMNFMAGVNNLSAAYAFSALDRGTVAVSAQYVNYGSMKETDTGGTVTGTFNAKDISFAGSFSYLLNDRFSAGISLKFLASYIAEYSSIGIGVDAGINYFNPDTEWSASILVKNLGGQVKAYNEDYEPMPVDVQAGVSKRLLHTPLRISLTFTDLNHLNYKFINHVAIGADLLLSYNIWVGGGYNFRRAKEMTTGSSGNESSHGAGWSLGGGINLERFAINVAWGKYHVSGSGISANISYRL